MTTKARLRTQSANRKTGPIPVSITSSDTCPSACGIRDACYAQFHYLALHWRRVDESGAGWDAFCAEIAALPPRMIWRHNEAGDLPGIGNHIDPVALAQLVQANQGKRGFTYTHKPVRGDGAVTIANRDAISEANACGFTINLSADDLRDADAKARLRIGPVTVLLPEDVEQETYATPEGRIVKVCPNHLDKRIQCWFCTLCSDHDREEIIGFPAHGSARRQITRRLRKLGMGER